MSDTEEIIKRVLSGDTDAYAILVRRHQREVWGLVAVMLLHRNQSEDLVQRTFVKAYHHLNQFKRGRDFGAWIKEIARNEVRQEIRSRQREKHRLETYHQHVLTILEDPHKTEHESGLFAALEECINQLPPTAAQIVQLRYERALDFSQIAALLGRTVEATRQQLVRIRILLRLCIQKRLLQL